MSWPALTGNRRDFLRVGGLGLGGLSLAHVLRAEAAAKEAGGAAHVRDMSVVLLFLCGGPSQYETFTPNMDAPEPFCSLTGEIATRLPGVTFGTTWPKLAERAQRLAIVRSYAPHDIADHAKAIRHTFTAGNALGMDASLGAIATRLGGRSHTAAGQPVFCELIETEIDSQYIEDMQRMRASDQPGTLGPACAPFAPNGDGQLNADMTLNLPLATLEDRRALLKSIDTFHRGLDSRGTMAALDQFGQQAVEVILGGAARRALDLSQEDPRVVARYDTSHWQVGWLAKRASTLGRRMLLARRLIEAGCRFVTVGMAGWDNHGNGNHPGVVEGMNRLARPADHVIATFLDDVAARGLSDRVLLVVTGEFGRTAKIQGQGGRDHWPGLCSLLLAGGGLKTGQVIGRANKRADGPDSEPVRLNHLVATILHTLFDVGQLRLAPSLPSDLTNWATVALSRGPLEAVA